MPGIPFFDSKKTIPKNTFFESMQTRHLNVVGVPVGFFGNCKQDTHLYGLDLSDEHSNKIIYINECQCNIFWFGNDYVILPYYVGQETKDSMDCTKDVIFELHNTTTFSLSNIRRYNVVYHSMNAEPFLDQIAPGIIDKDLNVYRRKRKSSQEMSY